MKKSILTLLGLGGACAACCLPLVSPLLAATGLSGILALRLAGVSVDYVVCIIGPWLVMGAVVGLLILFAWQRRQRSCACKAACSPAICRSPLE